MEDFSPSDTQRMCEKPFSTFNPDFAMEARQQVWMIHPDGESSDG